MERAVASRTTLSPAVCQVRGQGVLRAGLGPVGEGPGEEGEVESLGGTPRPAVVAAACTRAPGGGGPRVSAGSGTGRLR